MKSAEQQARDLLERMEVEGAQSFSAGELVELADIVADAMAYRRLKAQAEMEFGDRSGPTTATAPSSGNVFSAIRAFEGKPWGGQPQ